MLIALAKNNAPCSFIMPERIAVTDPFTQIKEYVGSGPMRFMAKEWVPGASASFEKFRRLQIPRRADVLACGRETHAGGPHRVGHHAGPGDRARGASERRSRLVGDPLSDLVPILQTNPDVSVDIADPLGNVGASA